MQTIGVGIIGSGFMGLTYSEVVARHATGCRLVAITGGRRAGQLAADYGVPADVSVDALLARDEIHAVVLATPDLDRLDLTRKAAAAGKHVLAEKPMAPTVAECDQMISACAAAKVNLAVVKTERFRKITRKAKELIDAGTLGPLQMLRTVSAFPLPLARQLFEERSWMADPRSGGLFMGMAESQRQPAMIAAGCWRCVLLVLVLVLVARDLFSVALTPIVPLAGAAGRRLQNRGWRSRRAESRLLHCLWPDPLHGAAAMGSTADTPLCNSAQALCPTHLDGDHHGYSQTQPA